MELQRRCLAAFVRMSGARLRGRGPVRARRGAGRDRAGVPRSLGDQLGHLPRRRVARGGARGARRRPRGGRGAAPGPSGCPRTTAMRPPCWRRRATGSMRRRWRWSTTSPACRIPTRGTRLGRPRHAGGRGPDQRSRLRLRGPTFAAALTSLPADLPLRLYQARVDGEPGLGARHARRGRRLRHLPGRHAEGTSRPGASPAASCTSRSPRRASAACAPRAFRRPSSAIRSMSASATRRSARSRCGSGDRRSASAGSLACGYVSGGPGHVPDPHLRNRGTGELPGSTPIALQAAAPGVEDEEAAELYSR